MRPALLCLTLATLALTGSAHAAERRPPAKSARVARKRKTPQPRPQVLMLLRKEVGRKREVVHTSADAPKPLDLNGAEVSLWQDSYRIFRDREMEQYVLLNLYPVLQGQQVHLYSLHPSFTDAEQTGRALRNAILANKLETLSVMRMGVGTVGGVEQMVALLVGFKAKF